MSECTEVRQVKKSRKAYRCDWCYELIEKGSSYKNWFCYSEVITGRMHNECHKALLKADLYYYEFPTAGTYRRGCHCGENEEHCECVNENRQRKRKGSKS